MKKITYVAALIAIMTVPSYAQAWDVYIYNKTSISIGVEVSETFNWGIVAQTCLVHLAPGDNIKCSTHYLGFACPIGATIKNSNTGLDLQATQSGVSNKCTNTRLEVTYDEQSKNYRAIWYTQY